MGEDKHLNGVVDDKRTIALSTRTIEVVGASTEEAVNTAKQDKYHERLKAVKIVTCAFCGYMLFSYQVISFGMYYVIFTNIFQVSKGVAGWIGSLDIALRYFAGIFVAPFIRRFGLRLVVGASGIIAFAGLVLSSFAPNVFVLYFTYSILIGISMGMLNLCNVVEIQSTFTTYRNIAQSVALMGQGLGGIIAGLVIVHLINYYGWRGTMLLQASFFLHILILSFGFRNNPTKPVEEKSKEGESSPSLSFACQVRNYFAEAFDFAMFRDPRFALFCIARFFFMFTLLAMITHLPSSAISIGMTPQQAMYISTAFSIGTLAGRLPLSAVASIPRVNSILLLATYELVIGLAVTAMALTRTFWPYFVEALISGLFAGAIYALLPSVLVTIFGLKNMARNQAMSLLSDGFASLIGTPFVGWLVDLTGSYSVAFACLIMSEITAVCFLIALYIVQRQHKLQTHHKSSS